MIFKLKDRPDPITLPRHMDVALIDRMLEGILIAAAAWIHCAKASLKYARTIALLSKSARDSEAYNVNLSIRAHVLASAEGIRWAIGVLGTGRIARWKAEFHCRRKGVVIIRRHIRLPSGIIKLPTKPRTYKWKLIALPKMAGMCFPVYYLGFKSFPELHPHFSQPRARRIMPPAVFWPHELLGSPIKSGMSGVEGVGFHDIPLGCAKRPFTRLTPLARSDDLRQADGEQNREDYEASASQNHPYSSLRAKGVSPVNGRTAQQGENQRKGEKPKKHRALDNQIPTHSSLRARAPRPVNSRTAQQGEIHRELKPTKSHNHESP